MLDRKILMQNGNERKHIIAGMGDGIFPESITMSNDMQPLIHSLNLQK